MHPPPHPSTACPACLGTTTVTLESIDLARQHADYTPDPQTQQRLTERAGLPDRACRMLRCARCLLEFAQPLQAPGGDWYDLVYETLPLYPSARWEFGYTLDRLRPGMRIGELGCGSGAFLQQCAAAGLNAAGVDFSPSAIAACQRAGLDAHLLSVTSGAIGLPSQGDRDTIVAFQVLEHLDQPAALFALASAWARAGTTLWVAIPSNQRPSRHFAERDFLDQPPHHMTRWTPRALVAIGDRLGWHCDEVIMEPMTFSTRLWWFATRHPLYLRLQKRGLLASPLTERAARLASGVLALPALLAAWRRVSGQTMLARFTRTPAA